MTDNVRHEGSTFGSHVSKSFSKRLHTLTQDGILHLRYNQAIVDTMEMAKLTEQVDNCVSLYSESDFLNFFETAFAALKKLKLTPR